MALKTILVHLGDDADNAARLTTAQALARQHGAHLTALFITRPLGLPYEMTGRAASLAYAQEAAARADANARALETAFRASCDAGGLSHDWIVEDKDHLDALAERAHAADLIVVSRGANRHFEDRFRVRLAEELVLATGLPILVLPTGYAPTAIGRRVTIGWKPRREAVRAIRDALPILQVAEKVILASIRPSEGDAVSALEVTQYLARQGVTAETLDLDEDQGGIGATLLAVAETHGSDLVVIGAYGHSRIRELMLGGVTRDLFRQSNLPLLLSH